MKKLYTAAAIVCLLLSVLLVVKSLSTSGAPEKPALVRETTQAVADHTPEQIQTPPEGRANPVDFAALRELNEDIYAWLYIPGTDINHPILQSVRGDNDYYLTHTVDRQEDENGCLFTEYLYSDRTFDVPVTVIYGHRRRSGDMFGQLQELYAESGSLERYGEIIVYTPEKELHYLVFGECEFSDMHIPYHYRRFTDRSDVPVFIEDLKGFHTMTRQFDDAVEITADDRLLVLSTCLTGNDDRRFLVVAKLIREIG